MRNYEHSYINGQWVAPINGGKPFEVVNPATEEVTGTISLCDEADAIRAIEAAHAAFDSFSRTSLSERLDLLQAICAGYEKRMEDMADAITSDMGAPRKGLSINVQAPIGLWHLATTLELAKTFAFEKQHGSTIIRREPVGVVSMITPWNWPMNQVACKVAPALVAGCTMVLKPSENGPAAAQLFAEILHEAGVPAGVFNMIHGSGPELGPIMSSHPLVDMVSLTGSTAAGAAVSKAGADTIKIMSLELGGKSANIILDDAPLEEAVSNGVRQMMGNSGQSCNAPSRMLVPAAKLAEAEKIAAAAAAKIVVGDPQDAKTTIGPIAHRRQYLRVQNLIQTGIDEGAKLVCGGVGRPDGLQRGFYAKPTVFSDVNNDMCIAREEIFGPVLTMIPYQDEEDAIRIANDCIYGLSGYVYGGTLDHACEVARRLRTGMVHLNGDDGDMAAPFGGYKQSGVGREWGAHGIEEFLEVKAIMGYKPA
ncbi:aldehyde dehydrogenase (NAD+) [Pseudomonas pohangensis]|uniref:Aldehyde dehydrogenase (NAD+) n=1 Tax=Pseudomonas pohangensis TaxID=364197 RepID=A0A1H2FTH5_9PSED|nr:aldehyde dehydrogenase family protein [Pseudomonas pohangensis]SDU10634.1 aldehyde dehydrogenase (NAD+) [Pseudomonas pohangensis]